MEAPNGGADTCGAWRVIHINKICLAGPGHFIKMVLRAGGMARNKGATAFHAHGARPYCAAIHLTQKGNAADGAIPRLQFKAWCVEDMAVMRDISAGGGRKADAEAVLGGMQAGGYGEMPAVITHGCVPGARTRGADIKPDAVIDNAPKRQRGIFKATFFAKRTDADGEAFHLADFHLAGIEIAQHQADIGFILPIRDAGADNANAHIEFSGVACCTAITNRERGLPRRPGIDQAAAHNQARGTATEQQGLACAIATLTNFQKAAGYNSGIHRGLQRRPIIGHTIAKCTEIPHGKPFIQLVFHGAWYGTRIGQCDFRPVAIKDCDIAERIKTEQPIAACAAERQQHIAIISGISADGLLQVACHLLQRGHLEIQLIIQGAGAQQAVFLKIRHARQNDAAAEHDARTICGRFQEGDGAAI